MCKRRKARLMLVRGLLSSFLGDQGRTAHGGTVMLAVKPRAAVAYDPVPIASSRATHPASDRRRRLSIIPRCLSIILRCLSIILPPWAHRRMTECHPESSPDQPLSGQALSVDALRSEPGSPIQASPPSKYSFFQIGTTSLRRSMK